eukprot:c6830_g1_i1.p1 GENE.c6830_g1_i1~~c6830_g1_i1.p1  ORF type:complete len:592 (+),score=156.24 c6830_g1_i1:30-1778(+)
MGKISQLIRERESEHRRWFSLEFYPYKTTEGVYNLFDKAEHLSGVQPLFADVTWGAGGSTAEMSIEIASVFQNFICIETQMHLTCTNMEKDMFVQALEACKKKNIQNILALRGDPPRGQDKWEVCEGGFSHAIDLVRFIKETYGDHFGICVAGYPEGHQQAESYEVDLQHLKEKVDAGAELIITQLFYDVQVYFKFVADCRKLGITCPILPGIMPILTYTGFKKTVGMCGTKVPQVVLDQLESLKDDEEAVAEFGLRYVADMCRQILDKGVCSGIHVYTMNNVEPIKNLLDEVGLLTNRTVLPWKRAVLPLRQREDVRPIFWSNRPKSYLVRTKEWQFFPCGRWGDNLHSFGEPGDWHSLPAISELKKKYRNIWGEELKSERDVFKVFCTFVKGQIHFLPWNEVPMRQESSMISADLLRINHKGYLTINSQPKVNAAKSEDRCFGWGVTGGRVYQKGYVECFASRENLDRIIERSIVYPQICIYAINKKGETLSGPNFRPGVNAVTWGIFPNSEVLQPTVMDPKSFAVWKDEAFVLWEEMWLNLYEPDSRSYQVLHSMIETYYLVTVVDNDFVDGNVFDVFP